MDRHPTVVDALLAAALGVATLAGDPTIDGGTDVALSLALVAPLVLRRRAPVAVFAAVMAVCLVQFFLIDHVLLADLSAPIATYTLVGYGERSRVQLLGLIVALAGAVMFAFRWTDPLAIGDVVGTIAAGSAYIVLGAALGDRRRERAAQLDALQERNRLLAVERDQQAVIGAAVERARVARELHDIVAHSLSVIVRQADGGRYAATADPAAARTALDTIAETGREALAEMRRLLGVLRVGGEESYAPQPGAAELSELVRQIARTGLPVSLGIEGLPRELPAGVDVTVYRVVQEALTNVMKHGVAVSRVEVVLRYLDDAVEVRVADDGHGPAPAEAGGHGLVGMRERVDLQSGTLSAGPREGGGFEVRAVIPALALERA